MARPLVLSDASPLIALGAVGLLSLLRALFSAVRTTATVHAEVVPGTDPPQPGEREVEAAVRAKWLRILKRDWSEPELPFLDPGEASVIRAAAHSRPPCLILLDDLPARAVAKQMGFQITGTAGLLLAAKAPASSSRCEACLRAPAGPRFPALRGPDQSGTVRGR